jgi:DNA-binding CsgD family transcriptional regulator
VTDNGFGGPELLDRVIDPSGPPLTVLTGPAGIGRTATLAALGRVLQRQGRPTLQVRLTPAHQHVPFHLAATLVLRLGTHISQGRAGLDDPARQAPALAAALRQAPGVVLLVDDSQWTDQPSLQVAARALRELAGAGTRCVCAVRVPADAQARAGLAVLDQLRAEGLARVLPLAPLSRRELGELVAEQVMARPHRVLVEEVFRASRGLPAAARAAVDGYRRAGSLRLLDGVAYFTVDGGSPPVGADEIPTGAGETLVGPIWELGRPAWPVAKAVAVLQPLGDALPALVGEALDASPAEVEAGLARLRAHRVLRPDRRGGWGFAVPATAAALRSHLGQYERRQLARVAVGALWRGEARCADPRFLPEQVRLAGRLVDRPRAARELLAAAATETGAASVGWLAEAVELAADRAGRVRALLEHLLAAGRHGAYAAALRSARTLLGEHRGDLSSDLLTEVELGYVTALRGTRDFATLGAVASGSAELPGGQAPGGPARTVAAWLLGRAGAVSDHDVFAATAATAATAADGAVVAGTGDVAGARAGVGRARVSRRVRMLAVLGDVEGAARVLTGHGGTTADLAAPDRCLLAWRRGQWRAALDLALTSMAADVVVACPPAGGALYRAAAEILFSAGWPVRATALVDTGHAERAALPQLMRATAAEVAWALGGPTEAARTVAAALDETGRGPVPAGAGELWLLHTELARARGDRGAAQLGVAGTGRAAKEQATDASRLHHLLARVAAERDAAAARSAVRVARGLGQPVTLARTLERVVRWTGTGAGLLREAYDLFGAVDALLYRHRARVLMTRHGVAVPDRVETAAESEQLLARLVAEGLSNRQLAAALETSEKGVEGRLSRLFARTGYRSRVELVAAILNGAELPR